VLRSKGILWFCTRHDSALQWSQAGGKDFSVTFGGPWYASTVENELANIASKEEIKEVVESEFSSPFGDRRQQIVLIGVGLNRTAIEEELDACLLTEEEMSVGVEIWNQWEDPFPRFEWNADQMNLTYTSK